MRKSYKGSRHPRLGDTLVVTGGHVGLVNRIILDKWGHQKNVYVIWQNGPPSDYNPIHGYSGVNIHNLQSMFALFRGGERL